MLIIDAHLDLSMNALNWDRNLDLDVYEIRRHEAGMAQKGRARGTVSLPELRKAEVGVCVATVIDRTARANSPASGSASQEISYAKAQGQLAYYRVLQVEGKIKLITDLEGLETSLAGWQGGAAEDEPLGFILGMEGADPIVWPEQVANWWQDGLRVVGPAHYGVSAYAHGTGTVGGLTDWGRALLKGMDELGMILDLSHLSEPAFWEALELFQGPVLASHNNCRALVPGDRQFSDEQLQAIFQRNGVIGIALDAWMLYPGWVSGETTPEVVGMEAVADQIDHICRLAGNTRHVGVGSDLDGGYGTEQTPRDLDTIADLQKIPHMLSRRGYAQSDLEAIMHGNWARFFRVALSESGSRG
ncbi:MAG: membrane dipeptidase [Anaerolineae bacterium]|nr:membrane dipeptidase [Anaerolineae bacterium]